MKKIIMILSVVLVAGLSFAGVTWKVGTGAGEVWTDSDGNLTAEGAITGGVAVTSGTGSVSTVTAADSDYGNMKKTVLTLDDTVLLINSSATTNTWGSVKIYDFPEGRILVHGVTVDGIDIAVQTNTIPLSAGGDFALGTVAASTNALSSTMVDLCPSTSIDAITNVVNSALASSAQFDGTTTAKDMYLNFGIDHQDVIVLTTATNTVDGVITIHWSNLGDY